MTAAAAIRLNLLVLKTRHLEQMRHFYAALGIDFVVERHGGGPAHYAGRVGDLVLELYPLAEDAGPAEATIRLGLVVRDLKAAVTALGAASAIVVTGPRQTAWGLRAVARDPDGRAVELYQG